MLDDSRELHKSRFCVRYRPAWQTRRSGIFGFLLLIALLIALFSSSVYSQIPSGGDGALQSGGEGNSQDSNAVDCSDPLMATTAECLGQNQGQASPLALSHASSLLAAQYGLSAANPAANYSDVEKLNPSAPGTKSQMQQAAS